MKKILLSAALVAVAGSASALDATGSAWACSEQSGRSGPLQYCTVNMTSATTATQLGRVNVDANKINAVVLTVSGTAISGLVSPTITYYVGNRPMLSQTVSATSTGNVVFSPLGVNGKPLYTSLAVSQSQPSLISSTNSAMISVQVNQ